MKAPHFWFHDGAPAALSPLSYLYTKIGRRHRETARTQALSIPVLCVGNIVSGGAGKTPTANALLSLIQNSKIALSPFFLTRGYRGKIEGPERVDDSRDPRLWGDEALLLSRYGPTIVSKNRFAGGLLAKDQGADLVIMDDGMQNYSLRKTVTFCVVDGRMGFGNRSVLPQGPLRQPLEDGFALSDAFIVIGEDTAHSTGILPPGKPVFKAGLNIKPDQNFAADKPYIGFCGIGYPEKFRITLNDARLQIADFVAFADHHAYTPRDIEKLVAKARSMNARLITTEKDYARLTDNLRHELIDVLAIEIAFADPDGVAAFIRSRIAA